MSQFRPDLQIKEPELEKYHNIVTQCFEHNDIPYEAEYSFEPNPKLNSVVNYTIEVKKIVRAGMIVVNKGEFGGVICKGEKLRYLEKEGFTDEQIFEEPIFATAPCVMSFVSLLAIPIINELEFPDELREEFDRQVKKVKLSKKTPKKGKL